MPNTAEQDRAIRDRGHDLLVSAPAGSGKTKVLVSRIVSLITDTEHPMDIDRLLVVTFTRAAAAEMRERVTQELEKRYRDSLKALSDEKALKERKRLRRLTEILERQQVLIHNAQITTIDSFCLFVVRNHFQDIALDPGFRIAEEGELKLLEEEVLDQVFESWYGRPDDEEKQRFRELVDAYSGKRNDQNIRDMVMGIYHQSQSNPWPRKWMEGLVYSYEIPESGKGSSGVAEEGRRPESREEAVRESDEGTAVSADSGYRPEGEAGMGTLMASVAKRAERILRDEADKLETLRQKASETPGLEKYVSTLAGDLEQLGQLPQEADYSALYDFFVGFKLGALSAVRGFKGDEQVKEAVKEGRNQVKKELENLKKQYFYMDPKQLQAQRREQQGTVRALVSLAVDYLRAMEKAKAGRHIVDFSDIEHFALRIFVDEETGELRPAAREFGERLDAIMIDEYQDSNLVQETIINAISGGADTHKLFMVGDVKQSIYRFRLARPELFMKRYNRYQTLEIGSKESGEAVPEIGGKAVREASPERKETMPGEAEPEDSVGTPGKKMPESSAAESGKTELENGCKEVGKPDGDLEGAQTAPAQVKITLGKNFRSRPQVLDITNDIFEKIMQEDLGNIRYDDEAWLHQGRKNFPEASGMEAEVLIADPAFEDEEEAEEDSAGKDIAREGAGRKSGKPVGSQSEYGGETDQEESLRRLEARMVGQRIRRLLSENFCVINERSEEPGEPALRPVRYSDIVILLRSLKGWAEDFSDVLEDMGIPAQVESSTGYFAAREVRVVLSFLQILDNPFQDIPMAAVLKSPIGGFSDEELAEIRISSSDYDRSFAETVWELMREPVREAGEAAQEGVSELVQKGSMELDQDGALGGKNVPVLSDEPDAVSACTLVGYGIGIRPDLDRYKYVFIEEELAGRLRAFGAMYRQLRAKVCDTPIHQLIQLILRRTGYGNYVAAMPAGKRRTGNLDMLVQKAIAYEKTSYKGLFHFVRYVEQLRKYEVDYGEAETAGENENIVRIMTIHKSKGLEFPVVFVSGCGKNFNQMDVRQKLVLHPDLGLGIQQITGSPRVRKKTFFHTAIADTIRLENVSEEMRILYVALTRAKEKLILTGGLTDFGKKLGQYTGQTKKGVPISYLQRSEARRYLDWIIPALMSWPGKYEWEIFGPEKLAVKELAVMAGQQLKRAEVIRRIDEAGNQDDFFRAAFSYEYPYRDQIGRKSKYSVSELKRASMLEQYDRQQMHLEADRLGAGEREPVIPEFIAKDIRKSGLPSARTEVSLPPGSSPGALRGTAMHRVMECLDFEAITKLDVSDNKAVRSFAREQLLGMRARGEITEEMFELVIPGLIEDFVRNPVSRQMGLAQLRGGLYREQPFVMEYKEVLVQGIIDAFWLEEGRIYVLDYKTDRVKEPEELMLRYRRQLELYAEALERYFDRKSRDSVRLLYAFHFGKVVEV